MTILQLFMDIITKLKSISIDKSTFISTVVGFISGVLVELIAKWIVDNQDKKAMRTQLLEELKSVKTLLDEYNGASDLRLSHSPYQLAAWNVAIHTGKISNISDQKYYQELIETFNEIERANEIESMLHKSVFLPENGNEIDQETISKIKNYLQKEIRQRLNDRVTACIKSLEKNK